MSIDHLHEGADPSALNDFDQFVSSMPPGPPPQEFIDSANSLVPQDQADTKQFDIATIISLAELLYQLYTFFKTHILARQLVRRAAQNPHGMAAMLVHHKVESRLPDKLKGIPKLSAGVTVATDAALTKVGV